MKKNPVNPKEYLRGTVSQVFPQWQKINVISERLLDFSDMEKESHLIGSRMVTIYSSKNKLMPLDCVFSVEENQNKKHFFVDVCSNSSPNSLIQFYKDLKKNLNRLPQKFYEQEQSNLLLGETHVSFFLPYAFSVIESKEGYVYLVDTTGTVEGEVFSQEVSAEISANETTNYLSTVKKKFYQSGKWYFEKQKKIFEKEPAQGVRCLRFSQRGKNPQNRKLYCFFPVQRDAQRNKKMFRVVWIFHYNANQIHEQNFQEKIEKYLFDSSVQLQSKKF